VEHHVLPGDQPVERGLVLETALDDPGAEGGQEVCAPGRASERRQARPGRGELLGEMRAEEAGSAGERSLQSGLS
jgi:hypothetical protein